MLARCGEIARMDGEIRGHVDMAGAVPLLAIFGAMAVEELHEKNGGEDRENS